MTTTIDKTDFVNSLIIKYVDASDIERAFQLESEGYPQEEAATLETLKYRQKLAPKLFLGAYLPISSPSSSLSSQLIGFVVSTSTLSESLTHESMSLHEKEGKTVCIHSVCVDKQYRRYGVATKLLSEYISLLKKSGDDDGVKYERCALLAHENLIPLYQNVGFKLIGESEVVHGPEKWFDLVMKF
ncbi:acyl-CoA N-acyltransferase [Glomus cerebriforme]|uniref:Acyl-CoA N-acyltransferase n=1 Tax=Glomus cerebriforme TaxID=658196 RepID=A0A397T714_9GLOM|nr:acyl-CoA N-acyltransferase [Glomus cerebriforme]